MNKKELQNEILVVRTAYLCWLCFGTHYIYFKKWDLQFLYWISLGGFGVWALYDLLTLSTKIKRRNAKLQSQINFLNQQERDRALMHRLINEDLWVN